MKITIEFEGIDDGNEEVIADKLQEDRYWRMASVIATIAPIGAGYQFRDVQPNKATFFGVDMDNWDVLGEVAEELKDIEDYYKSPKAHENAIRDLQKAQEQAHGEYELSLEEPY